MPKHTFTRERSSFLDHLRRQVLDLDPDAIDRRTTSGRLHVLHSKEVFQDRFSSMVITDTDIGRYKKKKNKKITENNIRK